MNSNRVTNVFGQKMNVDRACCHQLDCVFIRRVMLSPFSKILPKRGNNNKNKKWKLKVLILFQTFVQYYQSVVHCNMVVWEFTIKWTVMTTFNYLFRTYYEEKATWLKCIYVAEDRLYTNLQQYFMLFINSFFHW